MAAMRSRRAKEVVIRFAKVFPFVLCFIILVSYIDCCFALFARNYMLLDDNVILNTPINFAIARIYEYGIYAISTMLILSTAMETCLWNRMCVAYSAFQYFEKHICARFELSEATICAIILANIIVSGFLVWKGIKILNN